MDSVIKIDEPRPDHHYIVMMRVVYAYTRVYSRCRRARRHHLSVCYRDAAMRGTSERLWRGSPYTLG
jgi:hypothetical protein